VHDLEHSFNHLSSASSCREPSNPAWVSERVHRGVIQASFQISMHRASPLLTNDLFVSPAGVRSTWISLHGRKAPCHPSSKSCPSCHRERCGPAVETGRGEESRPVIVSFPSNSAGSHRAGLIDGCHKAASAETSTAQPPVPTPIQSLRFEVIAERPVAQHLEKRVVIGVEANVVEVIVFAAGSDASSVCRAARVGSPGMAPGHLSTSPFVGRGRWDRTGSCLHS